MEMNGNNLAWPPHHQTAQQHHLLQAGQPTMHCKLFFNVSMTDQWVSARSLSSKSCLQKSFCNLFIGHILNCWYDILVACMFCVAYDGFLPCICACTRVCVCVCELLTEKQHWATFIIIVVDKAMGGGLKNVQSELSGYIHDLKTVKT